MTASLPVSPGHDLTRLDSGNASLDRWLGRSALHSEGMRTARTFVWVAGGAAVAYYALAAHSVPRDTLPAPLGHRSPVIIPAYLLAKLALAQRLQGQGLGATLLSDALERCLMAGMNAGARLVVVDATDGDARRFYESQGFSQTLVPGRLAMKLSDVAEAYSAAPG